MVTGGRLNALSTLRRLLPTEVVARHVFYNNSAFDSRSAAASAADDNAIATDKAALLPVRGAGDVCQLHELFQGHQRRDGGRARPARGRSDRR